MRKRKFHSFSSRLSKRLVLTLLVVMGLTSFLVFIIGGGFAFEVEEMRHQTMLEASFERVNAVVSEVYVGTINLVPQIEEHIGNPDRMASLLKRALTQNPNIRSCGISFIENYYPQKGPRFVPYAIRRDSTHIETLNYTANHHDYLQSEWFLQGLEAEKGIWSEPFFEGNDTTSPPLVAFLYPIRNKQGRAVAVLGADLSLDWLQKKMEETDTEIYYAEWTGPSKEEKDKDEDNENDENAQSILEPYSFLISKKGTFIVHPDKHRIVKDNFSSVVKASEDTAAVADISRKMTSGVEGFYGMETSNTKEVDIEGRTSYVFFTPIKHADWSMGLVVPQLAIDLAAYIVGGVLIFFMMLAVLVVWLVNSFSIRRATKPLKQLAASADEVAKGNFYTPLPAIKRNDEIRLLHDSFENMQHSLAQYTDELKATTASKAAIENELKIAHDIQMAMLPKKFAAHPERNDIDIFGSLTPAKAVGGDLFDFHLHDEKLFFCIGDVSGKGVPASLLMAVTRSLFRNVSVHTSEPHHIVKALNDVMVEGNEKNMFVTLFVGVLDLATGKLRYSNAGHDAPMLLTQEGCRFLPCDPNLPVGVMAGWEFSMQETTLPAHTTVFLYTDGLNEAENANHAQFEETRIVEVAEKLLSEGKTDSETIICQMAQAVSNFVGEAEQSDDLTMLAIRYLP